MKDFEHEAVEQLLPLLPHIEIAHHVPGRIRLRIRISGLPAVQRIDVESLLLSIPGVQSLRINVLAKSIIIDYNQKTIPYDFWQQVEQLKSRPELLGEVTARLQHLCRN